MSTTIIIVINVILLLIIIIISKGKLLKCLQLHHLVDIGYSVQHH